MKYALIALCLTGCAAWHWERAGASADDYRQDEKLCKLGAYAGSDGAVTQAQVHRMHACLEARGWRKVPR